MCTVDADIKDQKKQTTPGSRRRNMIYLRREMWNDGYLLIYFRSVLVIVIVPQTPVNSRYLNQEHPVSFDIQDHQSLLQSKSITFKSTSRHGGPDWAHVTLEDDGIRIIGKKEVYRLSLLLIFFF